MGRFMQAASKAGQASSFIRPEILAIPAEKMDEFLASPALAPYKLLLTRIIRFKPHTLSDKEERLLAMQAEMAELAVADLPPIGRYRHQVRRGEEREGRAGRVEQRQSHGVSRFAGPRSPQDGLPPVLRAVQGPSSTRWPPRSAAAVTARHVQRQGPQLQVGARRGDVPRQRAGDGLRQPDRVGPSPTARAASLLRRAAAEDGA